MKEELISIIKDIGVDGARYIEENIDLQYFYIKKLYNKIEDKETLIQLVILNAISSYQLSSKAENWWREFSEYFSTRKPTLIIEDYVKFLSISKTNRRFVRSKIKRIYKLKSFLENLSMEKIEKYYNNMLTLFNDLSSVLNPKGYSKTLVFSIKMFGYACRIVFKRFIMYPFEIDIPLDSRIIKFTRNFTDRDFLGFWRDISRRTRVPPLHIDSILWPFLGDLKINVKSTKFNKLIEFLRKIER